MCECVSGIRGKKMREKKEKELFTVVYLGGVVLLWHQAIDNFPVWSFYSLRLNTTTALHCTACWEQVEAAASSVVNYHPKKIGIHCVGMTRWCHVSICFWKKLLNQDWINRGRAQQQGFSYFSQWLTLPCSIGAVSHGLCTMEIENQLCIMVEALRSDTRQIKHLVPYFLSNL